MSIDSRLQSAHGVLFDLDGTLVDTAPDMAAAVNAVRRELKLPSSPIEQIRPYVSRGAVGVLRETMPGADDELIERCRIRFLEHYSSALCVRSVLFEGLADCLDRFDADDLRWGVVTNKVDGLARPLLDQMGLLDRMVCLVAGDTLGVTKPDPAPVLHACDLAEVDPVRCLMVGDDARDVEAGRRAGCLTVAVAYGYLPPGQYAEDWGADYVVDTPRALATLLQSVGNRVAA